MSKELDASEALAMIPGWNPDDFDIEELKGGLTNRTYHLRCGDMHYVLRLDALDAGFFEFDRSSELVNLASASAAGIGPNVIYSDKKNGILVMEFLHGRVWTESDILVRQSLESLAALLRRVHALPGCGRRIDVNAVSAAYEGFLEQRHGLHAFASQCVKVIASIPCHDIAVCCHNDIVAANVVEGSKLMLIDWEYSCDNDPMFDLASVIGFHNLDEKYAETLLSAYSGGADAELRERLRDQVRVYDAIQWLWLASRHLVLPSADQTARLESLQQRIR